MTFEEFMAGYGEFCGSRGDEWLNEYIQSLISRGICTFELVSNEMQELNMYMGTTHPENMVGIGFAWSKRDRLMYMLIDWQRYIETGSNYF